MARRPNSISAKNNPAQAVDEQAAQRGEERGGIRKGRKARMASATPLDAESKASASEFTGMPTRRGVRGKAKQPSTATTPPRRKKGKTHETPRGRKAAQADHEARTDAVMDAVPVTAATKHGDMAVAEDAAQSQAQSAGSADKAGAAKPAAQWDHVTDTVEFDWVEVERTASQQGPNQGMAKLLIAARAEGAKSRWPLS